MRYYIIVLLEDFDSNINDREYKKDERLIVWLDNNCYRVSNNNMDFIPLTHASIIHKFII